MELKEIAAISGKPGLYKVLKPTRSGVILETIDDKKSKVVADANNRVSLLHEISIYTTGEEASVPLAQVLKDIHAKFGLTLNVSSKSGGQELVTFMATAVPEYDRERVYLSDIKKLVSWYGTLATYLPAIITESGEAKAETEEAPKEEAKPKKKAATKSKAE